MTCAHSSHAKETCASLTASRMASRVLLHLHVARKDVNFTSSPSCQRPTSYTIHPLTRPWGNRIASLYANLEISAHLARFCPP